MSDITENTAPEKKLIKAISLGDLDRAKRALKGGVFFKAARVNVSLDFQLTQTPELRGVNTFLGAAIAYQDIEMVRLLLRHGANPIGMGRAGVATPLALVLLNMRSDEEKRGQADHFSALALKELKKAVDENNKIESGGSPVQLTHDGDLFKITVQKNNIEAFEEVLSWQKKSQQRWMINQAWLHSFSSDRMFNYLQQYFPDPVLCCRTGRGMASNIAFSVLSPENKLKWLKKVASCGVDFKGTKEKFSNPLLSYLRWTEPQYSHEIIDFIIKQGVDVNAADEFGATPLMKLIEKSQPHAVLTLINAGARLDSKNASGETALDIAKSVLKRLAKENVAKGQACYEHLLLASGELDPLATGGLTPVTQLGAGYELDGDWSISEREPVKSLLEKQGEALHSFSKGVMSMESVWRPYFKKDKEFVQERDIHKQGRRVLQQ